MSALAAACGAGVGLGLALIATGLRSTATPGPGASALRRWDRRTARLSAAVVAGVATVALTRWPVAGLWVAGLGVALPALVGGKAARDGAVARTEAVASWAEMLRDTMAGAAGLEGAIVATAAAAPVAIRTEVVALAARLERERLVPALRAFADDVADPTADLVVAALILAAEGQARRLGDLLASLARSARDHAGMRLRVEAGRARTRTAVRVVVASTLAMAVGLAVLNRGYLAPYDSALGQLVLAAVGACFAGAFAWLARMAGATAPERFLVSAEATT